MAKQAKRPIPAGYHAITPHLMVRNAASAIQFYQRAFGAEVTLRFDSPDGTVAHADLVIGGSLIWVGEENAQWGLSVQQLGGSPVTIHLYVADVDAAFKRAVEAGAKPLMPPTDMFWGTRYGQVLDPLGQRWSLGTAQEELTREQMVERFRQLMKQASRGQ
jgi:uncharacterized glyoxalase superfamily protein PhnB